MGTMVLDYHRQQEKKNRFLDHVQKLVIGP